MKVRYWGVRGSIPMPGPTTVRHGGNTACVSVETADGSLLVLDGGTGLRSLGRALMTRPEFAAGRGTASLLFTHRHWDHIQGIPFFHPAYVEGNVFDLYAPSSDGSLAPPEDLISCQHNGVNFPVRYDAVRRAYRFHAVQENVPFETASTSVHPIRMNHPGVTFGYVITEVSSGVKLAYLCDTAPFEGPLLGLGMAAPADAGAAGRHYRGRLVQATDRADLMIYDTFFDGEAGYLERSGWGHSAPTHAMAIALDAGARRLHLFHFAPDLDDDAVARMVNQARAAADSRLQVDASAEGMEVVL